MSYENAVELAADPTYIAKVNMATTAVAVEVSTEIQITGAESYFGKRAALATQVLRSPVSFQDTFVRLCALQQADAGLDSPSMHEVVYASWNAVAGVTTNEIPNT
jgi:hypothetical protein